ncbi:histone-lysine N-methyltransferase SETMAR [Trichonephila clavipes]|nr:histone-lysine N-methyltransferase SETMAR [Trichonephila clavipes]
MSLQFHFQSWKQVKILWCWNSFRMLAPASRTSQVMSDKVLEEKLSFPIQSNSFRTAIKENRSLSLEDINQDQVSAIQSSLGSTIESLLCVPVPCVQKNTVAMIVCLSNKEEFGEDDEMLVRETFRCVYPILFRAAAYEEERRLREECQSLLTVAKNLFTHLALEFPNVGRTTLHKVVSEKLKFRKLCARCVPRLLTEEHKLKRMACALDFLDRYHKEGDQFLERIVTGDETWVSHITPESKRQSMEWRHTNSPVRVKAKRTISTRKVMATVFWDRHGVLLVEFMQQGTTINAAAYYTTPTKLRRAIQNKRRGLLTSGVLLLHGNAIPHSAINTQNLIRSFGWEQIDHPPYSPDWAPSDFHLFRYLKEFLGGKRFDTAGEVKEEVQDWLSSPAADVYDLGIQKLVERYDKCLNKYGKYVEQ